ncbi:MAG TPA: hypothetical protein VGS98_05120 [Thermoanaerobaculia bacterium]|jgi:hypothetical protein|nr:hypothetical protein [Thermoanaerobaculia bacterium]
MVEYGVRHDPGAAHGDADADANPHASSHADANADLHVGSVAERDPDSDKDPHANLHFRSSADRDSDRLRTACGSEQSVRRSDLFQPDQSVVD